MRRLIGSYSHRYANMRLFRHEKRFRGDAVYRQGGRFGTGYGRQRGIVSCDDYHGNRYAFRLFGKQQDCRRRRDDTCAYRVYVRFREYRGLFLSDYRRARRCGGGLCRDNLAA